MNDLPIEITEYIIDLLQGDLSAIKSCSLTCHSWLKRARYWMFDVVSVNIQAKDQFVDLQQVSTLFTPAQILRISGYIPGFLVLDAPCWSRCKFVTEIQLHQFVPDNLSPCIIPFLQNFPVLRSLTLIKCKISSLYILFQAISALPELFELYYDDLSWEMLGAEGHNTGTPTSRYPLRHLYAGSRQPTDFVSLLLEVQPNLRLWSIWTIESEADLLIMDRCASTLRTIDLRNLGQ